MADQTGLEGSSASAATIEDVQDKLDKFVLMLFEGARGHVDPSSSSEKAREIIDAYKGTADSVENLVGIEKTKTQQETELLTLSAEYEELRKTVLELEGRLKESSGRIDDELEQLLTDEVVGLKKKT